VRASLASLSNSRQRQSGAILIMVLLIVALVSALSIKFASQYQMGLARAESRWHGAQARAFLLGTEEVTKLLFPTADFDPKTDYLGEPWSNEVPIEDDGVSGVAKLIDATSKLNLNDLTKALDPSKPLSTADRYSEAQRRFIRLLQTFPEQQLRPDEAAGLLEAIVDWTDADDSESGQGGAESNYYQGLAEPYMPANAPFKSLDELRLVRGFNEQPFLVARLLPFLTVLPFPDVGININTLTLESPAVEQIADKQALGANTNIEINNLWLCINGVNDLEPLNPMDAQRFIAERPETGFADQTAITDTWNRLFAGRDLDTTGLNVKTDFFWLESSVQLVDQRRSTRSLLWRGSGGPGGVIGTSLKVIQRDDMFELPNVVHPKKDKKANKLW
jgi:general secretion pathway protein K